MQVDTNPSILVDAHNSGWHPVTAHFSAVFDLICNLESTCSLSVTDVPCIKASSPNILLFLSFCFCIPGGRLFFLEKIEHAPLEKWCLQEKGCAWPAVVISR
jgi:hypothetical protein